MSTQNDSLRIRRSEYIVPAHSLKLMAQAAASDADEVIFDLEDFCAVSQKVEARKTLVQGLNTLEFNGKIRAFRPNNIRTKFFYRDVIDVVEQAGKNLDVLVLPKCQDTADVLFADRLLTQIEQNLGLELGRIKLEVLIEGARAVMNAYEIASATPRMAGLIFGAADYAGDTGAKELTTEQFSVYHYPKSKTIAAARAASIDVVDSATLQFRDLQQCEKDARMASQMGFDGKWAVHADQVSVIHSVLTPTAEELRRASEILELYKKADLDQGLGAIVYKDQMVDAATLRIESKKVAIAKKAGLL